MTHWLINVPISVAKSRKILEAKTKYYEKMVKSKGNLNSDDHSLVMFNKKSQMEHEKEINSDDVDEL